MEFRSNQTVKYRTYKHMKYLLVWASVQLVTI